MLGILFIPGLISGLSSNVLAFFSLFALLLCLAFHWWKIGRAYGPFPSCRLDTKLLPHLTLKRPKNVTQIMFQNLIKTAKAFQAEGLCVLWFYRPYVIIYSEEFMKNLVHESALADKSFLYDINEPLMGNGLIRSKHEVWKIHRKMLNPAFYLGILKGNMRIFNEHAHCLTEKLQALDTPTDDVWDVLKRSSFQIMAECVLGLKLENKRHESIAENFLKVVDVGTEHVIERISHPWLYWDFLLPLFPFGRKYMATVNEANRLLREIIKELLKTAVGSEKEDEHNPDEEVIKSSGSILIEHHLKDPSFTEKDVRDQLVTLMVAGYESISVTMMWCFYLLGHHPHVQEKAYNEVQSVVPEGDLTYDQLTELKYLDCVIKETLRLYSTVPIYARRAAKEIKCGRYTIPKGAEVCFFLFKLHRNPNVFPQPEKFDPERFYDSSNIRPWMLLSFAEGYRSCMGKKFSMMLTKVLLVHVLRRLKITTLDKIDDSELDWTLVMKPTKLPRLLFNNRQCLS